VVRLFFQPARMILPFRQFFLGSFMVFRLVIALLALFRHALLGIILSLRVKATLFLACADGLMIMIFYTLLVCSDQSERARRGLRRWVFLSFKYLWLSVRNSYFISTVLQPWLKVMINKSKSYMAMPLKKPKARPDMSFVESKIGANRWVDVLLVNYETSWSWRYENFPHIEITSVDRVVPSTPFGRECVLPVNVPITLLLVSKDTYYIWAFRGLEIEPVISAPEQIKAVCFIISKEGRYAGECNALDRKTLSITIKAVSWEKFLDWTQKGV